jgi:hypothetical protein
MASRSRRQVSWYVVGALSAVDVLLLAVAHTASPDGPIAGVPLTFSESDHSQVERLYEASRMAAEPGIRTEMMKAVLYRTGQPSQAMKPPCNQEELTYGQVDPCG